MHGSNERTQSHSTTAGERIQPGANQFKFKKWRPGGSGGYPAEEAPEFNLESVSLALSQGWDPNTSWTEDELVFAPPGHGCVVPIAAGPWSYFNTPLHRALRQRQFDVAQLLLDHGADIDQLNASGRTVLHEAVDQVIDGRLNHEWTEKAAWIVEHGADLDKKTEDTVVLVSKESDDGESRRHKSPGGMSPLRMVIALRHLAKVQHLVEAGANVSMPLDGDGCWSPLDVAFLRRELEMVKLFENAGASFWTETENKAFNTDDIASSETSNLYLEESRDLLSFCLASNKRSYYSAEECDGLPPSSCQAVFRSIVDTNEFRTAWKQQSDSNDPLRYQESVSTFFRILAEKALTRNPLEIPKSYCGLCKDVITRLNSSSRSDLRHAPTFQDLERTAHDGCPFCGLLLDALDKSTSSKGKKELTPPVTDSDDNAIILRIHEDYNEGRMQVWHADKVSSLKISFLEEEFLDYSSERSEVKVGGTGSDRARSLSKMWLSRCKESHPDCRRLRDLTDPILPSRVLDVTGGTLDDPQVRLIEPSRMKRGTYCALSYCWGESVCITTTKANLSNHKDNIPLSTLPKTIADAVLVTRGLDIDYLWVDSLCIIQDDTDDWASEAARMDDIYANATLTISTLSGTNCDDGLFTPHSFRQQYALPFPIPPTPGDDEHAQWVVTAVHPPLEEKYNGALKMPFRGPIHSRGWTFQEQMLSTRILWFSHGHVQWECLSKFAIDSSPDSMGYYKYPGCDSDEPFRSRLMKKHLQRPFKIATTLSDSEQRDHANVKGESWTEEDRVATYKQWEKLVAEYTSRKLTKESDRIPAILGLANVMGSMLQSDFLMGVWKGKHLLPSLLWKVESASSSSDVQSSNTYPSWTWASKPGCAIKYSMMILGREREYSWISSLVAIDDTYVWSGVQGSITLKGPLGKLTPEQVELLECTTSFEFWNTVYIDDDAEDELPQGVSLWYIDLVKFEEEAEHGAGNKGYGYPIFPLGQPSSAINLLLEAADSEDPPKLFRRVGIAHLYLDDKDAAVREVTII